MKKVPNKIVEKVKKLRKQINELRHKYHVLNDPQITDTMYEPLMHELKKLEEEYPSLQDPHSPTQRIGSIALDKFKKIKHSVRQWSFDDAFSREDIEAWIKRNTTILSKKIGKTIENLKYTAELKIDGLHIVLTYKNGKLVTAATRGDGKVGEDVTQNIKTIHSVPLILKKPLDIIVEGEVWMSGKQFEKLNKKRAKKELPLYANPRNVAAGTIRQLDPKVVAERKLSFTAYDISAGEIPKNQETELKMLKELGFSVDEHTEICTSVDQIISVWKKWIKNRDSKEFWVDGLVLKINKKEYQDTLGYTGKSPRWAIALKFPAEQGTTIVKEINIQVGRTGVLTPVAVMEPVSLAGTTVTHATLHNFDEIARLDVRIGDTVVVEKAGDIIPKIIKVLKKLRTGKEKKYKVPTKDPYGFAVEKRTIQGKDGKKSVALYTTNLESHAIVLRKLSHFVSKKGANIDGLGWKILEQLQSNGLVNDIPDIFSLKKGDIEPLEGFGEKSAQKLINSINNSKNISLDRFIFALGIEHVGEETAIRLSEHFGSLKNIMNAKESDFLEVHDIGERVADSLSKYFTNQKNKERINKMQLFGLKVAKSNPVLKENSSFTNKSLVLTGGLESMSRDEAKQIIREKGGKVVSSVSKNTDIVIAGKDPGSKYNKAKELGVKVISENQFLSMIR